MEYEYTFISTDPNNDDLYYLIEWGDGIEEVIGVFQSGSEAHASHAWSEQGTYTIKCKAKDTYGAESGWGELTVTMSRNKAYITSPFVNFLQNFQQNHLDWFPILGLLFQRLGQ